MYLACLWGGALFAIVTIIFGDVIADVFDGLFDSIAIDHMDYLHPMVLVGGITVFGGVGWMLTRYTSWDKAAIAVIAGISAVFLGMLVYFAYVKPMKDSENSTGFSMEDLVGKIGEVIIPIPGKGYGEVLVKIGAGNTNQIAASIDESDIPAGARIVIGEYRGNVLYVFPYIED